MTEDAQKEDEHTIDELASITRVPSRTIRFYQSRGALMTPVIKGRVAYYGPAHVERLKAIGQLQDRGLSINTIRDLFTSIDKGETNLTEWLGLEQQLQASWSNDHPRTLTESELLDLAGSPRPGLIGELVRAKLVERRGEVFLLQSPALLGVAMKLEAAGVDLQLAVGSAEIVRKHAAKMAGDLTDYFVDRASDGAIASDDIAGFFREVRGTALEAVRVIFAREMEREMRKLLDSGKMATLPARVRKAKTKR